MCSIIEDIFGSAIEPLSGKLEVIRRFTFTNGHKMTVQVITLGATITSIQVPDNGGVLGDVVLGYDTIDGYSEPPKCNPYFGATIGRVANRIAHGHFKVNGKKYKVSRNLNDKHTLHGGFLGFSKFIWSVRDLQQETCTLKLQYVSPDKDEGFPGKVTATVTFSLAHDNCFHVRMTATTTKATPVSMTNHTYFNLAGQGVGRGGLYDTSIFIKADKIIDTDHEDIPTGQFQDVEGTPYDFRELKQLGPQMMQLDGEGFDECFCVNLGERLITVVAKAVCPRSGRWLELASDQPGLQFYTGNALPNYSGRGERPIVGKSGAEYTRQCGFCFETQGYPDAVNHPNFPSIILNPGHKYDHNVLYKFGVNPRTPDQDYPRKPCKTF